MARRTPSAAAAATTAWSNFSAGRPTKGIGFAIGTDRAILSIQESGNLPQLPGLAVFVAWMGAKVYPTAVDIARKLRDAGLAVELPPEEMKFKKSLGLADKLGARYALIIGEDEVASRHVHAEAPADAEQKKLSEANCSSIWNRGGGMR